MNEKLHLNDNDFSQIQYYSGRVQRAKGNYQNALKKFRESLMFANKSGDIINIAKACYQIRILNLFVGNMGVSIELLLKAKNKLVVHLNIAIPNASVSPDA